MNLMQKFLLRVSKPEHEDGCWLWVGPRHKRKNKNYGIFWARSIHEQQAHRVSYILFKGAIPEGMQILHSCDNPPCVNPEHLRAGTPQDNVDDREIRKRSRHPSGEKHGRAKLTKEQVVEIRASYIPNLKSLRGIQVGSQQFLANKYGVTKRVIRLVIRNDSYKTN